MSMPILSIPDVYEQVEAIRIFVHAVTSVGDLSSVNMNDKNAARAILSSRKNDIVVMLESLDSDCIAYYKELGFAVDPERIVVVNSSGESSLIRALLQDDGALDRIISLLEGWYGDVIIDSFTVTEFELQLVAKLKKYVSNLVYYIGATDLMLAQAVNRKDVARKLAIAANVPVAPADVITDIWGENGESFNSTGLSDAIQRQIQLTGGVVVKGAVGAAGSSNFIIKNTDDIVNVLAQLEQRRDNDAYLVEPLFNLSSSPNVTIWIDPQGSVTLVNNSNQCLSDRLVFTGSQYPCSSRIYLEIEQASERLAKYLYQQGLTGWAGFDFVEYHDATTDSYQFFFSEVNARYNAGMYAKTVFDVMQQRQHQQKLPIPRVYITKNLLVEPLSFATLKTIYQDLLFDPALGYGVMPVSPGRLVDGVAAFICLAATLEQAQQLAEALRQRSSLV
jgi:D-alanine-D-alanine ligase-like ATP-grasp enzyme